MSMFSRVGLGPFVVLIVLVVVLRHETWCSIVEILELGGVRAVERRVARERHQATTHDGGEAVGLHTELRCRLYSFCQVRLLETQGISQLPSC